MHFTSKRFWLEVLMTKSREYFIAALVTGSRLQNLLPVRARWLAQWMTNTVVIFRHKTAELSLPRLLVSIKTSKLWNSPSRSCTKCFWILHC